VQEIPDRRRFPFKRPTDFDFATSNTDWTYEHFEPMAGLLILLAFIAFIVIFGIACYNSLVSLRRQTDNAFGQIDVQLKRRYDLIPNLIETVKGAMKYEQETLDKVISARNTALGATTIGEKAAAEGQVQRALGGMFALAENYPDLKANTNMGVLQEELRSTENKVAFARQYYNDVVTGYNTKIETFPSNIFANMGNFKPKDLFEIENPVERQNVQVKF
jgi:LemA protein